MISPVATTDSRRLLYRIGRPPDPLAWPPFEAGGEGRFDDPSRRFRTLYAAGTRLACFVETLARFRPSLESVVAGGLPATAGPAPSLTIPGDWCDRRRLARIRLKPWQRWLDLRAIETREALRGQLAEQLLAVGMTDLDLGGIVSTQRSLTQAIAGLAYDSGYQGIVYPSRFDSSFHCWALFEGAVFEPVGPIQRIAHGDPDLRAVAKLFGLVL